VRFIISLSLSLIFFTWLLPLGVFIKPSQEKTACGGQRAICLCHASLTKSASKPVEQGVSYRGAGASPKQEASAGGGGSHAYLAAMLRRVSTTLLTAFNEQRFNRYTNPSLAALEHVPKA